VLEQATKQAQGFINHLRDERRLSKHTVLNYQRDLEALRRFCDQQQVGQWQQLTSHQMRAYVAHLHHHGLSARSIQRLLSTARSLFRYLLREGLAKNNPAEGVSAPKADKILPKTLEIEQAASILGASRLRTAWEIVFPLVRSGVVATFMFILILTWSEYLLALILSKTDVVTLPIQLAKYEGSTEGRVYGRQAALAVGITIPLIVIGMFIRKHLVRGFSFGMVKR